MNHPLMAALAVAGGALWLPGAVAQEHDHAMHNQHMMQEQQATQPKSAAMTMKDTRQVVHFPAQLRTHVLANMRDHLLALQQIQTALSKEEFDEAGNIAEARLGMSSMALHGSHEVAPYMPKAMQAIGSAMHHSASRLAVAAKDAGATGDVKPVLAAMADVTAQCIACHGGYRVK
jgi:hypothetical protein